MRIGLKVVTTVFKQYETGLREGRINAEVTSSPYTSWILLLCRTNHHPSQHHHHHPAARTPTPPPRLQSNMNMKFLWVRTCTRPLWLAGWTQWSRRWSTWPTRLPGWFLHKQLWPIWPRRLPCWSPQNKYKLIWPTRWPGWFLHKTITNKYDQNDQ